MSATDMIYDDMDLEPIEKLPPDAPHRPVELMVIDADKAGWYISQRLTVFRYETVSHANDRLH